MGAPLPPAPGLRADAAKAAPSGSRGYAASYTKHAGALGVVAPTAGTIREASPSAGSVETLDPREGEAVGEGRLLRA